MSLKGLSAGLTLVVAFVLGAGSQSMAFAGGHDDQGRDEQGHEHFWSEFLLSNADDLSITDSTEDGLPPLGTTCQRKNAMTSPPAAPSSGSFVYVYALPSDATAEDPLDRPRDCSDGTHKKAAINRMASNLAVFHNKESANLQYRTVKKTYTHAYNGTNYTVKGAWRFRSANNTAYWNNLSIRGSTTSPRLDALRTEMSGAGWNKSNTKYIAVFATKSQPNSSGGHTIGVAELNGTYGFSVRFYDGGGKIRYGCATSGDAFNGHEATHMVSARHTTDSSADLMNATINHGFKGSTHARWDVNRDNYHPNVRNHSYVIQSAVSDTTYHTCG